VAAGGPKTEGTKCDEVRLHDDKTTYTGVYAKGGPTNVDGVKDISQLCDRSAADVRGMTATYGQSR
jgi:p25-alpha